MPFILNDRPDLALELDADGVHVGQDDAPPALARRILGPGKIVGLSTHAPAEATAGMLEPVDYLAAGPVVPTRPHPGRAPGPGIGYIAEATRATATGRRRQRATLPLFITGGVTPGDDPRSSRRGGAAASSSSGTSPSPTTPRRCGGAPAGDRRSAMESADSERGAPKRSPFLADPGRLK